MEYVTPDLEQNQARLAKNTVINYLSDSDLFFVARIPNIHHDYQFYANSGCALHAHITYRQGYSQGFSISCCEFEPGRAAQHLRTIEG